MVSSEGLCLRINIVVRSSLLKKKKAVELTYYNKTSFGQTDCWKTDCFFFYLKNGTELKCTDMTWQRALQRESKDLGHWPVAC